MMDNKALFKQVVKCLNDNKTRIILRDLGRKTAGELCGKFIYLHPRQDILSTVIHEALHLLYEDWSENKVCRTEASICKGLSITQFKKILRLIAIKIE